MNNNLTICSVVYNDRKTQLFDFTIRSVLKYTKEKPKFIICDNGGNDLDKYKDWPNFTIISGESKCHGSLQHGESLNKICSLSNTKYTAIIESDCIVLDNKWNDIKNYKIMAAEKPNGLYHIFFMVFETEILSRIDFRPGSGKYRASISYKSNEDVGWRIKEKTKNCNRIIDFVDCKTGKGKYFDNKFQSDELWLEDIPIIAHFGRGSNLSGKAKRKGFADSKEQLIEWKKIAERLIR